MTSHDPISNPARLLPEGDTDDLRVLKLFLPALRILTSEELAQIHANRTKPLTESKGRLGHLLDNLADALMDCDPGGVLSGDTDAESE